MPTSKQPADFILPLYMNGLQGRMLRLPPPAGKKREILFVYGHHSSLERWWGVVEDLNRYGGVTMPDLPGFGGMQSLYKIGEKPTVDNLADYLAAFIKLRYKNKRVTIAGLSFGFVVATRMLQRYPDLTKKVDMLVSVVGFAHHDDFTFSRSRYLFYLFLAKFFSLRLPALFFRNVLLHPFVLRLAYAKTHNARQKFQDVKREHFKEVMDFEVHLWHANDVRTHMATTVEFLKLDNCHKRVDLPLWHISVRADRYFDNNLVEQHLRVVFNDFNSAESDMDSHAPSVIADMKTAAPLIPAKIRRILAKTP
jgi:pimeloyl-ACP methyl ester carboxylesterase